MFIAEVVKVLCFDTLLEVLILKAVKVVPIGYFAGVDSKWVNDGKVFGKEHGSEDPPLLTEMATRCAGENSDRMDEDWPGLLGLGTGGGAG